MNYETAIRIIGPFTAAGLFFLMPSCALISGSDIKEKAYQDGFRDGEANQVKRDYWAAKTSGSLLPPVVEPVMVPEHTAEDGVIIEAHEVPTPIPVENQ